MKSFVIITAVAGAAFASSALAAPTGHPASSASTLTSGENIYASGVPLQVSSEDGALLGRLMRYDLGPAGPFTGLAMVLSSDNALATPFNFQLSDASGFQQGMSRNHDGSMGAPLEYWGLVTAPARYEGTACLQRQDKIVDYPGTTHKSVFSFEQCNEADKDQWFRLQRGVDGDVLDYFPYTTTDFDGKYAGQTPIHIGADQGKSSMLTFIHYSPTSFNQSIKFAPAS